MTIHVSLSRTTLTPEQLDNLSSEFYGRVLLENGEDSAIEFENREEASKFQAALKCFTT